MKRKKKGKKHSGCDCHQIQNDLKLYVVEPLYNENGFIFPNGDFAMVPSYAEPQPGREVPGAIAHRQLLPEGCELYEYLGMCNVTRIRNRCTRVEGEDKCFMVVHQHEDAPTDKQIETLEKLFDARHHNELALWRYSNDCYIDRSFNPRTGAYKKPRKIDIQNWVKRCWED